MCHEFFDQRRPGELTQERKLRFDPVLFQRVLNGLRDPLNGIEYRPVEIEEDGFIWTGQSNPSFFSNSANCFGGDARHAAACLDRTFYLCQKEKPLIEWLFLLAGVERLELSTRGFGDRCSTN